MRWSLSLTLFVFFEFLVLSLSGVHALPLPEDFELFARGPTGKDSIKESSKNYRKSASHSSTSFHSVNGALTQFHHQAPHTPKKGQDADHAHEAQTAHTALGSIGHKFGDLPTPVRHDLKQGFNAPGNMIYVDQSTNRAKGQYTKQALEGPLKHAPTREDHKVYAPVANDAARKTAHNLDNILKKHNVPGSQLSPFRKTEQRVQNNIASGGQHNAASSSSSHGPSHSSHKK
jgi:hypothetical protein